MNAVAVVAGHADRAEAGQVPRQRGFDRQGRGIIAFDLDGAGALDQDVSCQARGPGDADAKTAGSLSERAVQIAVLVSVRVFRNGIGNIDRAAHRHIGGVAALDQDAGCTVGGLFHLDGRACVQIDVVAGIHGHCGAAGDGDGSVLVQTDVVRCAGFCGRGGDRRGARRRDHGLGRRLRLSAGSGHQGGDRHCGREQNTH
ncbi:hypothetical protein D3C72_992820 [compost metagenome]